VEAKRQVVTPREAEALDYLRGILETTHAVQLRYREDRVHVMWTEGVDFRRVIDWRQVSNHLQPEVILILATDKTRDSSEFDDHPAYAICPRSRSVFELTGTEIEYEVVAVTPEQGREVESALSRLFTAASGLDKAKRGETMRLLNAVQRLLR